MGIEVIDVIDSSPAVQRAMIRMHMGLLGLVFRGKRWVPLA
jgi:hypothetical protein